MRIISWNINGYRSITGQNPSRRYDVVTRSNQLFDYINKENPDIICLQETKAAPEQIDPDKLCPNGYKAFYSSCKIKAGYSGVVIFTKLEPLNSFTGIGIKEFDDEGRIIGCEYDDFILMNIYFPNGTSGDHRVDYKLRFYDALFNFTKQYRKNNKKIIICGDYNTAHKEIDLARPKENEGNSGFLPVEREKIDEIVSNGWIDTFRIFNKEGENYTWWTARGQARLQNIGWRIDYFFVTENMIGNVNNALIQPDVQGSDHCPILVDLEF